ncbi:MAG: hypothetical protein AVDCRST_MAG23-1191 [uncultured Sphingosinicella sp.]|uniref:Phage shock protein B n=1 Tax=uncultured Sphingosinicella sp. TaxID=478748 RepID=A0A6J4TUJ4_9SPHN|nr:hypothetical protein [uncultured Sphingosinicella sp.]CAA9532868.1 MAG: hypothetical protein AVDCRST_MAG23-1191 [uncultured Sphingosinicella sp.]
MIDNPFTMVVFIVGIVMLSVVLMVRFKLEARRARTGGDGQMQALGEEVARLKQRVAVLERIATDKNHLLEQEFERLRDPVSPTRERDALHR